ncbi:MAG: Gfo/Idh/MocA family oxidoreductase, partial [Bacteroidota bacterium]
PGYAAQLAVYGDRGSIVLEGGKVTKWDVRDADEHTSPVADPAAGTGAADPMAIDYLLHKKQLEAMVRAIQNDTPAPVAFEEGLQALRIIEGIYESAAQGREIRMEG